MTQEELLKNPAIIMEAAAKSTAGLKPLNEVFCTPMEGKVALVTGGDSGMGYSVVNRLAEAGAKVVIASIKPDFGKRAVKDFTAKGYDVSYIHSDVSKVADCYKAVEFTVETYGKIDILVAGAACWSSYAFLDMPEEAFDRVVDTDLKGVYYCAQAAARAMVKGKNPGKIILISSAAHLGVAGPYTLGMMTHYIAAKGGVAAMVKGIAEELKQYGIGVYCVAPGGMLTAGVITEGSEVAGLYGDEYVKIRKEHSGETPLATNPDMIALTVFAMCTSMSDFMQGEVVNVNGGVTLHYQAKPFSYTLDGCIPGPAKG